MKKSIIPNLFTFANLSSGVISLLCTINGKYISAAVAILCGALIDRYDGRVARALDVSSDLGKELDSLADLVSFGVAPSMLCYMIYSFNNFTVSNIMWNIILLIFPICGAYRLARYNATDFDGVFTGIPITVAGSILALLVILSRYLSIHSLIIEIVMAVLSYFMVSTIKFKKI